MARETVRPGRGLTRILRAGLENKGFSLIEVVSPCTTLFGPRNGFAAPLDMLVWLQAHGVKRQTYERLDDPGGHRTLRHRRPRRAARARLPEPLRSYAATCRALGRIIMKQYQIIIAGSGGQGIIVMGQMLARAALLEGRNAAQTQSYGIASAADFAPPRSSRTRTKSYSSRSSALTRWSCSAGKRRNASHARPPRSSTTAISSLSPEAAGSGFPCPRLPRGRAMRAPPTRRARARSSP